MKLSKFILERQDEIVDEWEKFARSLQPVAGAMSGLELRDHVREILEAISTDIESSQSGDEQGEKSKGQGLSNMMKSVGKAHAALRIDEGFKLTQLVAEYRALRATVLRLFEEEGGSGRIHRAELHQVTRFNEAVDEALVEATDQYMLVLNRTSDQFLAILGHDLRNPLGAIMMSAALITSKGADAKITKASLRILSSAERMKRMVNDLLDLTRTSLGAGIPIAPQSVDLEALCEEMVAELQAFHPECLIDFQSEGDLRGTWDRGRLAQVLSNLIRNAIQHGKRGTPVRIVAKAVEEGVLIEVQNQGDPIPRRLLPRIFDPMVRGAQEPGNYDGSTSLGLGLHIAREVAVAHGGGITVKSARGVTTFSVSLPRRPPATFGSLDKGEGRGKQDEKSSHGDQPTLN